MWLCEIFIGSNAHGMQVSANMVVRKKKNQIYIVFLASCMLTTISTMPYEVSTVEPGIMHTIRGQVRCAVWQGVQYEKDYVYPRDYMRVFGYIDCES